MGTNNLAAKSDGQTISSSDVNQYRSAFNGDIVPRNTAGTPTDQGGDSGNATYRWANNFAEEYHVGDPGNGLNIVENGTNQMSFETAGVERVVIDDDGLDGGGLKVGTIAGVKLQELTIPESKLINSSIGNGKLQDLTITGAKIAETSVPGSKMIVGSIDSDRLETLNKAQTATSGSFTTASVSFVSVLSVAITASRPIMITLVADENGTNASGISQSTSTATLRLKRDSTVLGVYTVTTSPLLPGSVSHVDFGLSGTAVYALEAKVVTGTLSVTNVKLLVNEL